MVAACAPAPQSTNTKSQGSLRRRWSSSMRREGSGCEAARLPCVPAIRPRFGGGRRDHEVERILHAARHEVGEAGARRRDAEPGVQVRALDVGVDGDHARAGAREDRRQVRRQECLPDAALAAAQRDQAGRALGG